MKNITLSFLVFVTSTVFSQNSNHSIKLKPEEKFIKIPISQMIDSVNIKQTGFDQFEFFEIIVSQDDIKEIDNFMKSCKSISSIITRFGKVNLDVATMSSKATEIQTLAGFYYSFSFTGALDISRPTLSILYPRTDKMF